MRDAFHEDLDTISDQLVEMTRLAGSAMARAIGRAATWCG